MLCQRCHQNQATVFFSQTVGNQTTQAHLCENCAREQSQAAGGAIPFGFNPFAMLSDFVNNFMNWEGGAIAEVNPGRAGSVAVDPQLQCPHCGYQLSTFRQNGRLGCTQCYESFRTTLEPLISNIHGNMKYVDDKTEIAMRPEIPFAEDRRSQKPEVKALREKMGDAILREQFEEAAKLRDEIKKIENT